MRKSALLLSGAVVGTFAGITGTAAYTYKVIHSFCAKADCTDGGYPAAGLVMDGAGNLFGTTVGGGRIGADGHDEGVVFELSPNANHTRWSYHVLHTFCRKANCADGEESYAPLIVDVNGNLYGTTPYGGDGDGGAVFKLSPNGSTWTYSLLYHFCRKADCKDGADSFQGLSYAGQQAGQLYDGVSPLYGTTMGGGKYGDGAVFRLTLDQATGKWDDDVLFGFCGAQSCSPRLPPPSATATVGPDGTLYTAAGDDGFSGNLLEIDPKGNGNYREHTDYTFCAVDGCTDGQGPYTNMLVLDQAGNVYGTTANGGVNHGGSVFEFDPSTHELTTLYSFCALENCGDGGVPKAGVLRDDAGDLFGTTPSMEEGAAGTAYELDSTGTFHLLYTFCSQANCADGGDPQRELISDSSGVLYGTTGGGGANGTGGTVYELVP